MTKAKAKKPTPKAKSKPKPAGAPPTDPKLDASQPLSNARHERFCVNLALHGMRAGPAYTLAGFVSANMNTRDACASRLLAEAKVQARVAFFQEQTAALAIDQAQITKADVLNMVLEQHQRNVGVRPVTITQTVKSGKDKGKAVTQTKFIYNEHAASQTLKLLVDEYGLGEGGSANRGDGATDINARAGIKDPAIVRDLENLSAARKLVLAGGTDVDKAKKPAPATEAAATLKKLAGQS